MEYISHKQLMFIYILKNLALYHSLFQLYSLLLMPFALLSWGLKDKWIVHPKMKTNLLTLQQIIPWHNSLEDF